MSDRPANPEQPPREAGASSAGPGDFEQTLRNPLPFSLGPADLATTERIMAAARQQHVLIESLWQLFLAPQPPIELLTLVRDFAKRHLASRASPFSSDQARLLYLAAIACAFVRSGSRITSSSDDDMMRQFRWAIHLPQTPAELRQLFQAAEQNWLADGHGISPVTKETGAKP